MIDNENDIFEQRFVPLEARANFFQRIGASEIFQKKYACKKVFRLSITSISLIRF